VTAVGKAFNINNEPDLIEKLKELGWWDAVKLAWTKTWEAISSIIKSTVESAA